MVDNLAGLAQDGRPNDLFSSALLAHLDYRAAEMIAVSGKSGPSGAQNGLRHGESISRLRRTG